MKSKVLLLSTYPLVKPRHGGQIRLANIKKVYESNGFDIINFALYEPENYPKSDVDSHDLPFDFNSPYRKFDGKLVPLITDLQCGEYVSKDRDFFDKLIKIIPKDIDVIHVEQPWLWPLTERLISEFFVRRPILIYGSQNIEWILKKDILESYSIIEAESIIQKIKELEISAAQQADIVCAVTESDSDVLSTYGAQNVILARNGISKWTAAKDRLDYWRSQLPMAPWILYVASGHPPNFTGFKACIGDSLACIPPDSKLVVVGSVCESLYGQLVDTDYNSINKSRLQLLYMLSDEDLAAVKELATAFLLPIPHGGGSNIKTAEAIFSKKYVIATETALRGYERYKDLDKIKICHNSQDFTSSIRSILNDKSQCTTTEEPNNLDDLLWEHCLQIIPQTVKKVIEGK
ncbi:hypothetical protein V1954_13145 [Yersinia sp. 2538 StPb PI]|uniref:hypothetical protein n=1 Tax=Yersinia sp. 2538 StPb PI TaxID=3117405 RepID=UPI003FA40A89